MTLRLRLANRNKLLKKTLSSNVFHLLVQATITGHEKRLAYENERSVWTVKRAFMLIDYREHPHNANVICSHTMFKRKDCERVKTRSVPWGHRDLAKQELRIDSLCLNLEILRIVHSIAAKQK